MFPNIDEEAYQAAKELVDRAPELSQEQLASIQAAFARGDRR
ncbi:hypothetical protein OCS65_12990 [Rhodococcus aetherivorans]|uniref:Uncharacterized protein n=1 Tax=Rhodococcus aetherivorans TaxID=191292 RepID=A0AA46P4F0_9NOCA|nr:hypothetical protein [Rhodococcus aetherivorans]UYF96598.1 hypothetical protein OCS65_12990 [Rhodococcus aetherivorans]